MLEGNELRTPEEFVWPSVPTRIASLRVQSGPQRLSETSLSRHPHHLSESKRTLTADVQSIGPRHHRPLSPRAEIGSQRFRDSVQGSWSLRPASAGPKKRTLQ